MSKDRQNQRREQQASVKEGDRTPERFQVADLAKAQADLPTMSAFELDTLGMRLPEVMKRGAGEDDGGFRARLSARLFALLPLQDSVTSGQPARDVTQAGPAPTVSDEVRPCVRPGCENPAGRQSVRQGVWLCEVHRGISEPAAGTAKDIPASDLPNGFSALDEITVAARTPEIYTYPDGLPALAAKPPANIPKAVHHLRKAANALHGDALRPVLESTIAALLAYDTDRSTEKMFADIAAALDHDVHAGGAAKDVRAAIEARPNLTTEGAPIPRAIWDALVEHTKRTP